MHKQFIITVTLVIVMLTTLIGSSFMKSYANCIGLDKKDVEDDTMITR